MSNDTIDTNNARARNRALADKIRMRRESAKLIEDAMRGAQGPANRRGPVDGASGAPKTEIAGCDDSQWAGPKPSSNIMALAKGIKDGSLSESEFAFRLQQAITCPVESPSGTYKDIFGFVTSTDPTGTANGSTGVMVVTSDETFSMKRFIIADELTIGVRILDILVANKNMFTNVSATANAGYSASVFSSLNPCPLELDFPAVPGGLTITVQYLNQSGAALVLLGTGYGQAYGC